MPGDQDLQCPPWVMRRQLARIPGAEFIVLGTARSLQPQRATVHPLVLGFFQRNDESMAK
jgi:hypothetical protein